MHIQKKNMGLLWVLMGFLCGTPGLGAEPQQKKSPVTTQAAPPKKNIPHVHHAWAYKQKISSTQKNFVLTILSLVTEENEKILQKRKFLEDIHEKQKKKKHLSQDEKKRLRALMNAYKAHSLQQLLIKVDIVPPSLALAQAIQESGWGTYSVAKKKNSCFGMCKSATALISYPNMKACVVDYIHNYNCHPAYVVFRKMRSDARQKNIPITGIFLIPGLKPYSTHPAYFIAMKKIIRSHDLAVFDFV